MFTLLLCCWKRVFAVTSVFSWQNSVSLWPASFCTPRPTWFACYSRCLLTSYFCIPVPCHGKDIILGALEGLVDLHRTVQLQLLQHYWSEHTCITVILNGFLETNRDHPVVFETASKYCISDSFVNYEGYSISSKGFWPTVVDIMVIWVKFTHSSPF